MVIEKRTANAAGAMPFTASAEILFGELLALLLISRDRRPNDASPILGVIRISRLGQRLHPLRGSGYPTP
ncbi:hypothetical protein [Phytomonospora endophytica]|uniref:Uncharacterized protein n=1 Tax=Phytomonospora endophytica TaxID=714109 RepID=A0A841FPE1_9ACTN|nr:hypothetical protein [Phytomonospora endophytica]MBB6037966.1 hypothetical protein [Phytomonospora endophytica]